MTSVLLCVPHTVQRVLLKEFHDTPISGHMGITRTHNAMAKQCYWQGMHKSIVHYINSCTTCQQNKATHDTPAGLARPLPVPERPYAVWGLDFIMMPPNHNSKNCCVVFVCHKSKLVQLLPLLPAMRITLSPLQPWLASILMSFFVVTVCVKLLSLIVTLVL